MRLLAASRRLLGRALSHAGELDEAEFELEGALATWRKLRDHRATAVTLSNIAFVAFRRGAYVKARKLNLDALELLRGSDDRYCQLIKIELARAEYGLGNYTAALELSREVLPALEAEAAEGGLTCVILMLNQCTFLLALDEFDEAAEVTRRALAAALDPKNPRPDLVPYIGGTLAKIVVLQPDGRGSDRRAERLERCAKLIGWNEAVCALRGESDPDEAFEESSMIRRELGKIRAEALFAAGAELDHASAVKLMRSLVEADAVAMATAQS
ncbi:MAG: tetratricopeptide repeat protein [Candidatus Eremiobacteraeota bacterium]|nr:tetratricopeptide repeat protein [Candidatus Eremiobacteraeota bacterium]